jgi:hypothetical protein
MIGEAAGARVFLCHSSADKSEVRALYRRLRSDGFAPWLDEEDLLGGARWELEIQNAVRESEFIVVCLSRASTTKTGYVHKEIKEALDAAEQQPEGTIFIVPVRLEPCAVPQRLSHLHWVDLFEDLGYVRLTRVLRRRNLLARPTETMLEAQLDHERLIEYMRSARAIALLNTWIAPLGLLAPALSDALTNGACARILMLHPESRAATLRTAALAGTTDTRFHRGQVREGVMYCLDVLGTVAETLGELERAHLMVRLYDSMPSMALYCVDERAFMSVFVHGKPSALCPQLEVHGRESLMGGLVFGEFETLWESALAFQDVRCWREEITSMGLPLS